MPALALADPSSTSIEQGYQLGQIQHPRVVAMGDAVQVFGGSTTAVFANPANLQLMRNYHLEAFAALSPEARRQSYGGAVVDSSTSKLAGGFGGTWSQMDPDGIKRTFADLRLALAYPLLSDRISVGATARYLRVQQKVSAGPLGASLVSDGLHDDPLVNTFTFDAGAAVKISEQVRLGLSGRNLTAPGTALAPTALAGGVGWSNETVTIEADTLVDFTTWRSARPRVMIGGELLAAAHIPIRAGYQYDDGMKIQAVSAGLGYVDNKFSIDFAGRRDLAPEHPSTMLSLGVRFFIDSGAGGTGDAGETF